MNLCHLKLTWALQHGSEGCYLVIVMTAIVFHNCHYSPVWPPSGFIDPSSTKMFLSLRFKKPLLINRYCPKTHLICESSEMIPRQVKANPGVLNLCHIFVASKNTRAAKCNRGGGRSKTDRRLHSAGRQIVLEVVIPVVPEVGKSGIRWGNGKMEGHILLKDRES